MTRAGVSKVAKKQKTPSKAAETISGACLCGGVVIETDVPVFWAWHDHSEPSRRTHGAAYATYVGCWASKVRIAKGEGLVTRYEDQGRGQTRSFCSRCGTPVMFTRKRSAKWVNIPRALFGDRTGREAKYHVAHDQMRDWAYLGQPVGPLKGYPGVSIEKTRRHPRARSPTNLFEV